MLHFVFLIPLLLCACAHHHNYRCQIENAQAFVLDSYKIKEEAPLCQDAPASSIVIVDKVGVTQNISIPNSCISLRAALNLEKNLALTNKDCIFVIRQNFLKPIIYRLTWDHITHLSEDGLLLVRGDVVLLMSYHKLFSEVINRRTLNRVILQNFFSSWSLSEVSGKTSKNHDKQSCETLKT